MENSTEKTVRSPALLIGHALAGIGAGIPCLPPGFPSGCNLDQYFLLHSGPEENAAASARLLAAGVPLDQILLCTREPLKSVHDPLMGLLEILPGDQAEEIRLRLLQRLETQRHRKLAAEIERARQEGIPSDLSAEEWCNRLETAHLAHGFSCAMELSPLRHGLCIRLALQGLGGTPAAWEKHASLPELLALCARLALRHPLSPGAFREEFRQLAANLPFRMRTDLRDLSERCMEGIWRGVSHVA